jgi:hypothetical protein
MFCYHTTFSQPLFLLFLRESENKKDPTPEMSQE